jgi:hypothetical protein
MIVNGQQAISTRVANTTSEREHENTSCVAVFLTVYNGKDFQQYIFSEFTLRAI